ncbi:hypothetical protein [Dongshaea marina]|uniref:hypothetical protein n=1 Tax=Dongshaea marina TaxID=2047966 RepID=UPI000D3E85DB|nr:hypothetical protein [Dongshaea marina]
MRLKTLLLSGLLCVSNLVLAVGLNTTTLMMNPQQGKIVQDAENTDTKHAHLIQVNVIAVDSPYTLNPLPYTDKKEVLWTPARVLLPPENQTRSLSFIRAPGRTGALLRNTVDRLRHLGQAIR